MSPYRIGVALVSLLVAFALGMKAMAYIRDAQEREETVAAQKSAIHIKELWDADTAKTNQEHAAQVGRINARLADALERLRQRPDRMPEPAREACKGGSGAELSGPDAGFLERYAARADELRASLKACYAWIDTVTAKAAALGSAD